MAELSTADFELLPTAPVDVRVQLREGGAPVPVELRYDGFQEGPDGDWLHVWIATVRYHVAADWDPEGVVLTAKMVPARAAIAIDLALHCDDPDCVLWEGEES